MKKETWISNNQTIAVLRRSHAEPWDSKLLRRQFREDNRIRSWEFAALFGDSISSPDVQLSATHQFPGSNHQINRRQNSSVLQVRRLTCGMVDSIKMEWFKARTDIARRRR